MYEIEVTVTTYTPEELKLTADLPLIWLQATRRDRDSTQALPGRNRATPQGTCQAI
jgi:hypothetical protein